MKLRVWNGKEMIQPELFCLSNGMFYETYRDYEDATPLDDCKVMEFIGRKDEKGIDIYVGDVVKRPEKDCDDVTTYGYYEVIKDDVDLLFKLKTINSVIFKPESLLSYFGELSIIANIYEHEYLLQDIL